MKVSICMATFNGSKYIRAQLDSIIPQLKTIDEIIISDDGSSDDTLNIIDSYKDSRIKVLINSVKRGVAYNFENAISHCTGDYIFLSDQDDVWLPNKIELNLNKLKDYDLVVSNCKVVDENLGLIHESYFKIANSSAGVLKNLYRSSYLGCCLAFNRSILVKIMPFPKGMMLYHDWWIGFMAEISFTVHFMEEQCMLYRRHQQNLSATTSKSKQPLTTKIFSRVQLVILGFSRILKNYA